MKSIAQLEKFSNQNFILGIEVSQMTKHSSILNKLRNVNLVKGRTGNFTIQKKKKKRNFTTSKSKLSRLS